MSSRKNINVFLESKKGPYLFKIPSFFNSPIPLIIELKVERKTRITCGRSRQARDARLVLDKTGSEER